MLRGCVCRWLSIPVVNPGSQSWTVCLPRTRWGDCQALLTIHLRAVGERKAMMEKEEEAHQSAKRQKLAEEEKLRKELQDRSYR